MSSFTKIRKIHKFYERQDKINIFEYFNLIRKRKACRKYEQIDLELLSYFQSKDFNNEFSFIFNKDHLSFQVFRLFLVNRDFAYQKLEKLNFSNFQADSNKKFSYYINYLYYKLLFLKRRALFDESIDLFINNQIYNKGGLIIEASIKSLIRKEMFSYIRLKNKLNQAFEINNDEYIKEYIRKVIYKEEKIKDESKIDKIYIFLVAHYNYIDKLNTISEIEDEKIYWGLTEIKEIL